MTNGGVVVLGALGIVPVGGVRVRDVAIQLEELAAVRLAAVHAHRQQVETSGVADDVGILGCATIDENIPHSQSPLPVGRLCIQLQRLPCDGRNLVVIERAHEQAAGIALVGQHLTWGNRQTAAPCDIVTIGLDEVGSCCTSKRNITCLYLTVDCHLSTKDSGSVIIDSIIIIRVITADGYLAATDDKIAINLILGCLYDATVNSETTHAFQHLFEIVTDKGELSFGGTALSISGNCIIMILISIDERCMIDSRIITDRHILAVGKDKVHVAIKREGCFSSAISNSII